MLRTVIDQFGTLSRDYLLIIVERQWAPVIDGQDWAEFPNC